MVVACPPFHPTRRGSLHVEHAWWCPVVFWQSTTSGVEYGTRMHRCLGQVHAKVCPSLPPPRDQWGHGAQQCQHGQQLRAFLSPFLALPLFEDVALPLFCCLVPNLLQSLGALAGWLLCTTGAHQDNAHEWQWYWRQTQTQLGSSTAYLGHGGCICLQPNALGSILAKTEMARFSFGDLSDCCQPTVICACLCPTIIGPRQA